MDFAKTCTVSFPLGSMCRPSTGSESRHSEKALSRTVSGDTLDETGPWWHPAGLPVPPPLASGSHRLSPCQHRGVLVPSEALSLPSHLNTQARTLGPERLEDMGRTTTAVSTPHIRWTSQCHDPGGVSGLQQNRLRHKKSSPWSRRFRKGMTMGTGATVYTAQFAKDASSVHYALGFSSYLGHPFRVHISSQTRVFLKSSQNKHLHKI